MLYTVCQFPKNSSCVKIELIFGIVNTLVTETLATNVSSWVKIIQLFKVKIKLTNKNLGGRS